MTPRERIETLAPRRELVIPCRGKSFEEMRNLRAKWGMAADAVHKSHPGWKIRTRLMRNSCVIVERLA